MRGAAALCVLLFLSGCLANWRKTSSEVLYYSLESIRTAQEVIAPYYKARCVEIAKECVARNLPRAECPDVDKCEQQAKTALRALRLAVYVAADANFALGLNDKSATEQSISVLSESLSVVRESVNEIREIPADDVALYDVYEVKAGDEKPTDTEQRSTTP